MVDKTKKIDLIILFDLDGTLIDSTEAILESFDYAFDALNIDTKPKEDMIKSLIGYPLDVMFEMLGFKSLAVELVSKYKENYRIVSKEKTYLLPHAKKAIELAATNARLGIVTTKTARFSKELLENFDLMSYFEVLIGREDVKMPKPDAEPILLALKQMNVTNSNVWLIGDTCLDIKSANAANIDHYGVLSGYGTKKHLEECAQNIVNDVYIAVKKIVSIK